MICAVFLQFILVAVLIAATVSQVDIVNRQVQVAVTASSWPTTSTSPICEAWAYLQDDQQQQQPHEAHQDKKPRREALEWKFLDNLLDILSARSSVSRNQDCDVSDRNSGTGESVHHRWSYHDYASMALAAANRTYYQQEQKQNDSEKSSARDIDMATAQLNLLNYTLALRAYSPTCELHRSLARDLAIDAGLYTPYDLIDNKEPPSALVVLYPGAIVLDDVHNLSQAVQDAQNLLLSSEQNGASSKKHFLLPGEVPRPANNSDGDSSKAEAASVTAVLYANVGTQAFQQWYTAITTHTPVLSVVLRHMGDVTFHKDKNNPATSTNDINIHDIGSSSRQKTYLQGYGVRLDIRNVEYNVFDSKYDENSNYKNSSDFKFQEDDHSLLLHSAEFIAGINVKKLSQRASDATTALSTNTKTASTRMAKSTLLSILSSLLSIHNIQTQYESSVPQHMYERRHLSLQAASAVALTTATSRSTDEITSPSNGDPLFALRDISQNLPSRARYLQQLAIPQKIKEDAEYIWDNLPLLRSSATTSATYSAFHVFVNGKRIPVERPSFNMFEFMNTLRQEHDLLSSLLTKVHLPSPEAYQFLHQCIMGGEKALLRLASSQENISDMDDEDPENDDDGDKSQLSSIRIDVGRGGTNAILYLNDIERDARYRSWSTSMQPLLYGSRFGPPSRIRRNLFTLLIVLDPLEASASSSNLVLDFAAQLMQASIPVRIGLIIVSDSDLKKFKASSSSGDGKDWEPSAPKDTSEIAQTHHVSELIYQLTDEYEQRLFGLTLSFLLSWNRHMDLELKSTRPTIQQLLEFYSEFVYETTHQYLGTRRDEVMQSAKTSIMKKHKYLEKFKNAVAFASSKGISPGVSFLNGRPLPATQGELQNGAGMILGEEINHLVEMVLAGELTDDKPRSLYAKLLTGKNVYSRYHPMLSQSKKFYRLSSDAGRDRKLFFPVSQVRQSGDAIVPVIVEGVFDVCHDATLIENLALLEKFVSMALLPDLHSKLQQEPSEVTLSTAFHFQFISCKTSGAPPCAILSDVLKDVLARAVGPSSDVLKHFLEVLRVVRAYLLGDTELKDVFAVVKPSALSDSSAKANLESALRSTKQSLFEFRNADSSQAHVELTSVSVNGRVLSPMDRAAFSIEDIKLVLELELERSKALAVSLQPWYFDRIKEFDAADPLPEEYFWAVNDASGFLGQVAASESGKRTHVSAQVKKLTHSMKEPRNNSLIFSWNCDATGRESGAIGHSIMVEVTAVVDPLNKSTQRLMPILEAVRDNLHLPLRLVLAPNSDSRDDLLSLSSYYRFVASTGIPAATFSHLPKNHVLTMRLDIPEGWNVQQEAAIQDTDNLRCDAVTHECGDEHYVAAMQQVCVGDREACNTSALPTPDKRNVARVEYGLVTLLFFGQCYDLENGVPPNGLQLTLSKSSFHSTDSELITKYLSSPHHDFFAGNVTLAGHYSDTLVMQNLGYWQLRALPGVWDVAIAKGSRGDKIFRIKENEVGNDQESPSKMLVLKDFVTSAEFLRVERKPGFEKTHLLIESDNERTGDEATDAVSVDSDDDVVHVFSLATGHLYERFLKIMILSVTKRTSTKVKFWLFENFLSPSFKASAAAMAADIGCEIEYVTYKWPEWLRAQSEKQRIIWGYKILFLDVLFPLKLKKIIYVDADQVVRGDLRELWEMDLEGAPYGYTPFCDSRSDTVGYQFWRAKDGFWAKHLQGRPYHISALYVVDLARFRKQAVGDKLRAQYQQLSADPNSLANLDQDLPNYAQHIVPIFSLPQEWLWCESWCSDETKAAAKTIDLCNNPLHKEPKLSMAKRVISGELFNESWTDLDEEARKYDITY